LDYLGLGTKISACVFRRLSGNLIFTISELVAVESLYNEHREMKASESMICGILRYVTKVSLMDVFLRSCAGRR